jgi:hypothetical protein
MTSEPKTPEFRPTSGNKRLKVVGPGSRDVKADSTPSPTKSFDPNRFQAHRLPPGFLGELLALELPSMPRDRLEETIPPTSPAIKPGTLVEKLSPGTLTLASLKPTLWRVAFPFAFAVLFATGLVYGLWHHTPDRHPAKPATSSRRLLNPPVEAQQPLLQPPSVYSEPSAPPTEPVPPKVTVRAQKNVTDRAHSAPRPPQKTATLPAAEPLQSRAHFDDPE